MPGHACIEQESSTGIIRRFGTCIFDLTWVLNQQCLPASPKVLGVRPSPMLILVNTGSVSMGVGPRRDPLWISRSIYNAKESKKAILWAAFSTSPKLHLQLKPSLFDWIADNSPPGESGCLHLPSKATNYTDNSQMECVSNIPDLSGESFFCQPPWRLSLKTNSALSYLVPIQTAGSWIHGVHLSSCMPEVLYFYTWCPIQFSMPS